MATPEEVEWPIGLSGKLWKREKKVVRNFLARHKYEYDLKPYIAPKVRCSADGLYDIPSEDDLDDFVYFHGDELHKSFNKVIIVFFYDKTRDYTEDIMPLYRRWKAPADVIKATIDFKKMSDQVKDSYKIGSAQFVFFLNCREMTRYNGVSIGFLLAVHRRMYREFSTYMTEHMEYMNHVKAERKLLWRLDTLARVRAVIQQPRKHEQHLEDLHQKRYGTSRGIRMRYKFMDADLCAMNERYRRQLNDLRGDTTDEQAEKKKKDWTDFNHELLKLSRPTATEPSFGFYQPEIPGDAFRRERRRPMGYKFSESHAEGEGCHADRSDRSKRHVDLNPYSEDEDDDYWDESEQMQEKRRKIAEFRKKASEEAEKAEKPLYRSGNVVFSDKSRSRYVWSRSESANVRDTTQHGARSAKFSRHVSQDVHVPRSSDPPGHP
ncbi:uncharacterized protein LOC135823459 isoform X1 [Sycon ciliatum]|uniref:uncharacterized protein LOC135823459 isoform X1 n=1 Tax=Sycon ciliatum TaxID=27933 RepID=UPI0031F6E6F4